MGLDCRFIPEHLGLVQAVVCLGDDDVRGGRFNHESGCAVCLGWAAKDRHFGLSVSNSRPRPKRQCGRRLAQSGEHVFPDTRRTIAHDGAYDSLGRRDHVSAGEKLASDSQLKCPIPAILAAPG